MKLTLKDKEFVEKLRVLSEQNELRIQLVRRPLASLVLRRNYGDRIEAHFRMTRQGVRWRFQRIFSQMYVSAYETIYWVESNFGTSLRKDAIAMVKERVALRRKALKMRPE